MNARQFFVNVDVVLICIYVPINLYYGESISLHTSTIYYIIKILTGVHCLFQLNYRMHPLISTSISILEMIYYAKKYSIIFRRLK